MKADLAEIQERLAGAQASLTMAVALIDEKKEASAKTRIHQATFLLEDVAHDLRKLYDSGSIS